MISYITHTLNNGLSVLLHEDADTPLVTINLLYKVGARNESPSRTGFAHLFEHLMFGGTKAVPDFDRVVNQLGGEANAFTNNDFTNYYLTVPATHLEEALQLEADRMRGPLFTQHALEVQRKVVTEEYNQRYINQPYGDMWLILRPLCYDVHPYRWCTIGADIRHVQEAPLEEVEAFFHRYYNPNNALMAIAGNIHAEKTLKLVERLFGSIANHSEIPVNLDDTLQEPEPIEARRQTIYRNVPTAAITKAYLMSDRLNADFYCYDLISDVLSNGQSSRFYNDLVKRQGLFSEVNAYITGDVDKGLFVCNARLCEGINVEVAEAAIDDALQQMVEEAVPQHELQKVVNKYESTFAFSQYKAADRAQSLCYYHMLGHIEWVNSEPSNYYPIRPEDLQRVAAKCFQSHRSRTLVYLLNQ